MNPFKHPSQRHDEPPAYDQVIGLPPSYDSVIILNGVSQSRGASVVGSVRNSVLGTVRSLRRSSRAIGCEATRRGCYTIVTWS